ncbi:hypothetical protein O3M35_003877 [Rhynocoris fuscipes]|uniref:Uncharacterized protein n=1 Tax=Rhynocoris fuscipes TaxID=488301 RepID=A0AAW1CHT4_9HEMI
MQLFSFAFMIFYIIKCNEIKLTFANNKVPVKIRNPFDSDTKIEGYLPFPSAIEAVPPKVKRPPYLRTSKPCPGVDRTYVMEDTSSTLCGDLNKGFIPLNPMNQYINGLPYPFELIKVKTLEFLSKTLPVLQSDETIPKVTNIQVTYNDQSKKTVSNRLKRSEPNAFQTTINSLKDFLLDSANFVNLTNHAKKYCNNGGGVVCLMYKAIQGERLGVDIGADHKKIPVDPEIYLQAERRSDQTPPTPCPANIEYVTPVFARNYQGVWRYIVQIPYEGYFTQTVEVTKCINTKCYYIDGKCLSSPRWVSLLVSEIFYPDGVMINNTQTTPVKSSKLKDKDIQCDGHDNQNGCYQVRLYYDWFLIPGSCKCWRPNYLSQFLNKVDHNFDNN